MPVLTARTLVRYGVLGLPLAFVGLPIYVHVPRFYADILHIDLTILGLLLLSLRLADAFLDPLIGWASDRFHMYRLRIMAGAVPMLIAGYGALFCPSLWAFAHPSFWLGCCLVLVYLSFSTLMINYYAMGIGLAEKPQDHVKVAGFREGFMLLGVLLASLLPPLLQHFFDQQTAYALFGFLLAPLLIVCAIYCLQIKIDRHKEPAGKSPPFLYLLAMTDIRWILAVGFCNAVPTAITSTLFLFFTRDILRADTYSGPLLALYFLSAACGMPIWNRISFRYGKKRSLMIAMLMAIICFCWAATLGAGDLIAFALICGLSGLTLGADSMLLPAFLSDALTHQPQAGATGFGLWNFTSKLTMAFAAGLVLPLLSLAGYHSEDAHNRAALTALSYCYALVPCLIKAGALVLLYISPLDRQRIVNE